MELWTHNALADVTDWSGPNYVTETRFPAANLARGTPGLIARWREDRRRDGRLIAFSFPLQVIDRLAIIHSNVRRARGFSLELAPDLATLLAGGGSRYPIPETWIAEARSVWVALPQVNAGAAALWAEQEIETVDDRPLQIGSLWLARRWQTSLEFRWGAEEGRDEIGVYAETEIGAPVAAPLASRRVWSGTLPPSTDGRTNVLARIHRELQGRARSAILVPGRPEYEVAQVRLQADEWRRQALAPGLWTTGELIFVEEPYGAPGV